MEAILMDSMIRKEGIEAELKDEDEANLYTGADNKCDNKEKQEGLLILDFLESFKASKLAA